MLHKNKEGKWQVRQIPQEDGGPATEKNAIPWIQKYLDLADLLIRRGRRKKEDKDRNFHRAA